MIITRISASLLFVLVLVTVVQGKDMGTTGAPYALVGKDALRELDDRAKEVDWSKAFDRKHWEEGIKS